jgi:hypothetical protein
MDTEFWIDVPDKQNSIHSWGSHQAIVMQHKEMFDRARLDSLKVKKIR